jgi:hypothetical protein
VCRLSLSLSVCLCVCFFSLFLSLSLSLSLKPPLSDVREAVRMLCGYLLDREAEAHPQFATPHLGNIVRHTQTQTHRQTCCVDMLRKVSATTCQRQRVCVCVLWSLVSRCHGDHSVVAQRFRL